MRESKKLTSYPPTWRGELLLACRKCQKKLKGERGFRSLSKLKKTVARWNKSETGGPLHLIQTPCMDLCPKGGVTVCLPQRDPTQLSVLRSEEDLARLCEMWPDSAVQGRTGIQRGEREGAE